MKVLVSISGVFESVACVALDIIKRCIKANDEVYVVCCDEQVNYCILSGLKKVKDCSTCSAIMRKLLKEVYDDIHIVLFRSNNKNNISAKLNSVCELKEYTFNGVNIGLPTASQLITVYYDDDFDTRKKYDDINACLNDAWYSYENTIDILKNIKIDKMYIYNGRFPFEAGMMAACSAMGIPFETYDCIGATETDYRYRLVTNHPVSSISEYTRLCNEHYATLDKDIARQRALRWLQNRLEHNDMNLFIKKQKIGRLPDGFSKDKINIAYFNSSSFEYVAVPEFKRVFGPYTSESEMLKKISEDLLPYEDIHIYARMHPNLERYKNKKKKKALFEVGNQYKNLTVIAPDSPVDSYNLVRNSDVVIVTVSMMGFESALMGKPVIVLGDSIHKNLGGFYTPHTHEEVISVITSHPKPLEPIGSIKTINYTMYDGGLCAKRYSLKIPFWERLAGRLKLVHGMADVVNFVKCFWWDMRNCIWVLQSERNKRIIRERLARKQVSEGA